MTDEHDIRRMILRRLGPQAEDASSVAKRVSATAGVDLVDRSSASALLVDGQPSAIDTVIRDSSGWTAIPISGFEHPETRLRIHKPPE